MSALAGGLRRWWQTSAPWSLPVPDCAAGVTVASSLAGRPLAFPLGVGHLLIAGVTGSGKSTVLRNFIRHASSRPDVALVGIDLKAVELAPWRPRLSGFATEPADALQLLLVVAAELRARRAVLLEQGAAEWDPAWGPWLVVVVDELSELAGPDVTPLLVSIGRLGRALGIHLVAATQRPDADTLTGALRGQFDWRLGLRVRDVNESRMIAPTTVADLTTLNAGGEAMWLPPLPHRVQLCRATWLAPRAVPEIAERTAHLRPAVARLDVLAGVR